MSQQGFQQAPQQQGSQRLQSTLQARMEEMQQRVEVQQNKEKFAQQIANIHERAVNFCTKYGQEDWRTQLMVNFLDVLYMVQDTMEVIESVREVADCMNYMMTFTNNTLQIMDQMMSVKVQGGGFFANLRAKRQSKKYSRSLSQQFNQVAAYMEGISQMGVTMSASMQMMSAKMRAQTERATRKGGAAAPAGGAPSRAMAEVLKASGASASTPSAPAAPADGGIDDIV